VREGYDQLIKGNNQLPGIFINYNSDRTLEEKSHTHIQLMSSPSSGKVRLAIVGAGSFVRDVHLPNLVKLKDQVKITAIVNKKGASSLEVAKSYGADFVSTSLDDITTSSDIDAVLIGTRHDSHSEMIIKCLEAGKHVFVEKPLAIQWDALKKIQEYYDNNIGEQKVPLLLTGFNRRFSPCLEKIKQLTEKRNSPIVMNYQINTKCLDKEHWQRSKEGGGRNLGEACHVYDVFTFLAGAEVKKIAALSIGNSNEIFGRNENFSATISFEDGSIGNLTYTSLGSTVYPKEIFHIFCDQSVIYLNNYKTLKIFGPSEEKYSTDASEKGHLKEIETFLRSVRGDCDWPIPLWQQIQATEIALTVEDQINGKEK
jgi:predicted dehydrogenase